LSSYLFVGSHKLSPDILAPEKSLKNAKAINARGYCVAGAEFSVSENVKANNHEQNYFCEPLENRFLI